MNDNKSEPQFNVIYEDNIINCVQGKDNFFFAAVVYLNFAKNKNQSLNERIKINEFIHKIITE
jgi:hypothetical protein